MAKIGNHAVVLGASMAGLLAARSLLLWRRVLRQHDVEAGVGEYTRLGLCTVPTALVVAVVGLWASARLLGT
jgi:arsenical pump membrane protein